MYTMMIPTAVMIAIKLPVRSFLVASGIPRNTARKHAHGKASR